jgi:hypothetical protein
MNIAFGILNFVGGIKNGEGKKINYFLGIQCFFC